jgi:two-component system, NarL family, nitrate/nitrite response regulator NarL
VNLLPESAASVIRVCLIDDHKILVDGLASMLSAEPDIDVVGQSYTVTDGLAMVSSSEVDLVLLDLRMNGEEGFDFLDRFKETGSKARVVILAGQAEDEDVIRLAGLGVSGVILKTAAREELLKCIRQVASGEPWFSPQHLSVILRSLSTHNAQSDDTQLTEREKMVLRSVMEGLSNKEIADKLQSRESAIKFMLQTLFRKTGVHNRSQLVRVAFEKYRDQLMT